MTRGVLINLIAAALLLGAAGALYFAGQRYNPPGFYLDEASIGYNALTIARHGVDEYGEPFPLYFRAFGEYKNPTYIYILAAVFRFAEPGNLIARRVAAVAGFVAALLLAWLAWRMTQRRWITVVTLLTALFTPNLFEISRLAFEVCCFPLVLALFLLSAHVASTRARWTIGIIAALVSTLVLLTLTYSAGRLLAPMLLVGLLLFITHERKPGFFAIVLLYGLGGVVPLLVFQQTHNGAMTQHFLNMTYLHGGSLPDAIAGFEQHAVDNLLPLGMALKGDPNERHHVPHSGGGILLMTFVLAIAGAWAAIRERDRWLLFLFFGTLASVVPASLTVDRYHTLRLVAYPVFLIALSIAAMQRLRARPLMAAILILGIVQAAYFFVQFHRYGGRRFDAFDAGSRRVVNHLLDLRERPIYLPEGPTYALAWWYAALRGVDRSAFVVLRGGRTAPPGSLLMTADDCHRCALLIEFGRYHGYRTTP